MVFSLFGKKPQSEPVKPAAKKPVSPKPASAPVRPAAPAPGAEPAPPGQELGDLDFTGPGAIEVHDDRHAAHFELSESSTAAHPVIEEAAVLFANGQDEAALAALDEAVGSGELGAVENQAWAMLFDLYQVLGKRDLFEQRALDYSVKHEKSPPTWIEPARQAASPALTTGGTAFVAFVGKLDAGAEKTVRQLEKTLSVHPVARVEFSKLQEVDAQGARMLLDALKAARKARRELVMSGDEHLAGVLAGKIETGRRDSEELWLLLLELYQHMGRHETFEDWAVNYAVTFEVSPPSWEHPPAKSDKVAKPQAKAKTAAAPETENAFALSGEMFSAGSDAYRQLIDFAGDRAQVLIDCSQLKRMDFVSAGLFLNTLTNLQITGCKVTVHNPNHLLFALFGVLGINQIAHVEPRKF